MIVKHFPAHCPIVCRVWHARVRVQLTGMTGCNSESKGELKLLNVSYDPTRELWKELNEAFIPKYEKESGQKLTIDQSHGGSASQARAIIDGMKADVATLSIWTDTDALRKQGLLKANWEEALPNKSLPYTSTVVFVVRKGNPEGHQKSGQTSPTRASRSSRQTRRRPEMAG